MRAANALLSAAIGAHAASLPRQEATNDCTNPQTRVEWRELDLATRKEYTDAVLCMKTKPSRLGLDTSLYDDFPYVHAHLDTEIHFVASFLPWHRYFLHLYEKALQDCGYSGVATYWDWTLDAPDVPSSTIWDPETGFGGNGSPDKVEPTTWGRRQCVADGPFQDLRLSYNAGRYEEHCLSRSWNNGTSEVGDMLGEYYTAEKVALIQAEDNYDTYRQKLEGGPHGAVHSGIAGDMMPSTSPNDPIFFLHHGQIDRLWWLWQQQDPEVRDFEFAGDRTQNQWDGTTPPRAADTDIMRMYGLAEDLEVKEFLSAQNSRVCYQY